MLISISPSNLLEVLLALATFLIVMLV